MLPVILINGAYTGSAVEISSTLGVLGEDIRMAYYATAAGIAVSYPLVPDVRKAVTTKTVLLIDLLLQALLSFICAQTTQMDIVIVCSFWIGILKGFAMIEVINMVKPLFSPADIRSEFYAYFYPIVFSGGQLSIALTAQLAYHYQWQHMYYFIILLLLVAVMFVLLFFRYSRQPLRFPVHEIDGRSVLLISSVLLLSIYVATYGQMLDWFASKKLVVYTVLIPFLLWLFIHRQQTLPKPYLKLDVLNDIKPLVGYLYMMLAMFFSSTSTLVTNYVNTVLHVDNVHANLLYLGLIPGFAVGGVICYWWFRYQRWKFRFLIAGGMACFTAYLAILYFRNFTRRYLRDTLPAHFSQRARDDDYFHRIRHLRGRGSSAEPDDLQRIFPDFVPFGARSRPVDLFLQQPTLPAAATRTDPAGRPYDCARSARRTTIR